MIDTCYVGDVRDGLRALIASGVRARTCVTSPPYWGLRDYGVDRQLGLEPTIAEYVANMVEVFRLVRDVLTDDGTLWLNLGDTYFATTKGDDRSPEELWEKSSLTTSGGKLPRKANAASFNSTSKAKVRLDGEGLKPKDLCGIPWRVAFALQADGWYLRSDVIWHKPNPMPESVTDRPTKAHEYLFLLAKSERYFYDAEAIAEPSTTNDPRKPLGSDGMWTFEAKGRGKPRDGEQRLGDPSIRNKRSVWTIATEPYADAHFATFPTALVEPCILAGSRPGDIVLDPFMGSGTVAQVAQSLGRRWYGCELNPKYVEMQKRRAAQRGLELTA